MYIESKTSWEQALSVMSGSQALVLFRAYYFSNCEMPHE
jgi:hypothetical protein